MPESLIALSLVGAMSVSLMNRLRYFFSILIAFLIFGLSILYTNDSGELMHFSITRLLNIDRSLLGPTTDVGYLMLRLTTFLTLLCTISARNSQSSYNALLFLLEAILIVFFSTNNILVFFIAFEASLIPIFFIIGLWGSKNRIYAAFKIIMYTLSGSIGFLASIIYLIAITGAFKISVLAEYAMQRIDIETAKWLWTGMFISFAVKIPMVPFHSWLPDAHVEAPAGGSAMLAGVLIKLGAYGMINVLLPIFPEVSREFAPIVLFMSVVAIIYTSVVALAQTDIKKLVAYSSIAHMGIVTAGLFSFQPDGIKGAVFQMISHGIVSAGLFLCIGCMYDRTKTRDISYYSGLANFAPLLSFCFIGLSLAAIGLPGTSGFVGEFLSLAGLFRVHSIYSALCTTGILLSACYMLYLCKRVIWGAPKNEIPDLHLYEAIPIIGLIGVSFFIGLYPRIIIDLVK